MASPSTARPPGAPARSRAAAASAGPRRRATARRTGSATDPAGRERSLSFTRKVDGDQRLIAIEDSKRRGAYVDPKAGRVAFGEWAERWYKTTAGLKPSTRHYYRQLLDGQVLPRFRAVSLAGIDRMMVREWIAALIEDGPGASRIRNAHAVLSMVLASAVDANRLAVNVAAGVRGLPRRPEHEMHFLTEVQVEHLADAIDPRYRLLVLVGAYTGLRPGEILGLKVKRLNLVAGTARVAEALTEVDGKLTWGTPKNHERRTVPLPPPLPQELGAWLADRPHSPEDLVFTAARGGPIREHKLMERYFKPAAIEAGLKRAEHPPQERRDARHRPAHARPPPHGRLAVDPRRRLDQGVTEDT